MATTMPLIRLRHHHRVDKRTTSRRQRKPNPAPDSYFDCLRCGPCPETLRPETLRPETLRPETLPPETLCSPRSCGLGTFWSRKGEPPPQFATVDLLRLRNVSEPGATNGSPHSKDFSSFVRQKTPREFLVPVCQPRVGHAAQWSKRLTGHQRRVGKPLVGPAQPSWVIGRRVRSAYLLLS